MSEQGSAPPATQFALQRIYIKDASFESPGAPEAFRQQWKPKINLELNTSHSNIEGALWEVVLNLTVTTRDDNETVMYLVEVVQAGIFHIEGLEANAMEHTLGSFCPGLLFPYAREAIDGLVVKGSFPALMLAPVNFDAVFEQAKLAKARQDGNIN